MLREIQLFSPRGAAQVSAHLSPADPREMPWPRSMELVVKNNGRAAFGGQLRIAIPTGWKFTPETLPVAVAVDQTLQAKVQVTPPALVDVGRTSIYGTLVDADGKIADVDSVIPEFAAPVEIRPQSPGTLNNQQQPLSAVVKNVSTAPVSGTLELQLKGPQVVEPITQPFGPIAPGETATVAFAGPNVGLARAAWTANYTATARQIRSRTQQSLSVRLWSIVGPFEKAFGPERPVPLGVDLTQSYVDMLGHEQKWKIVATESSGMLDLTKHLKPHDNVCAYAVIYVRSTTSRKALFSTGTDDGARLGSMVSKSSATTARIRPWRTDVDSGRSAGRAECGGVQDHAGP